MPRVSKKELAARPLRYFSHDSDALQDEKCQRLVARYGPAGYGRFWMLCERLASCDGHGIPYGDPESDEILARWLLFNDVAEMREFIEFVRNTQLCTKVPQKNKSYQWLIRSKRMDNTAAMMGNKRAASIKAAGKRWDK